MERFWLEAQTTQNMILLEFPSGEVLVRVPLIPASMMLEAGREEDNEDGVDDIGGYGGVVDDEDDAADCCIEYGFCIVDIVPFTSLGHFSESFSV